MIRTNAVPAFALRTIQGRIRHFYQLDGIRRVAGKGRNAYAYRDVMRYGWLSCTHNRELLRLDDRPDTFGRYERLPTAALVHLELEIDRWQDFDPQGGGRLLHLWRPKELWPEAAAADGVEE